jgi:thiol-disulfide isomerase/thioredoxin
MKTFALGSAFALLYATTCFARGGAEGTMGPGPEGFFSAKGLEPREVPFTTELAAEQLAVKGPAIYFFAASWCPNCQALVKNAGQNVSEIPRDVTLVLVNHDAQTALKQKYGITSQHSFVQINPEGKGAAIWAGSPTIDDILRHIVRSRM